VTAMIALLGICSSAAAQVATTTIQDTVYEADGTPASGTVVVTWPTFTTAAGQAVAAGNTSATIGPNGALSLALTPNANATPTGTYYTAVLHLADGTTSQQYWVVPVSSTPVTLAAIENQVLPTSVAMQVATRAYVNAAIAAVSTGGGTGTTGSYVPITGGTMTGALVLPADPVTPNQAADKHYVDTNVTALTAGLGEMVSTVPTATQTIAQPAGTQLQGSTLNGELYASQFQTGGGNNGIANAVSSPGCGSGCTVVADPSYAPQEPVVPSQIPNEGHVADLRNGGSVDTFVNPKTTGSIGETLNQYASGALNSGGGGFTFSLSNDAMVGGTNQLPGDVETPPYGKSTYGVSRDIGTYNTEGQHIQNVHTINCYAVGDCLEGSWVLTHSGGYRDEADEGAHPFDLDVTEDLNVFQGTCASGCTTGSTSLLVNSTAGGGTQGEGRYLIDKNPAKTVSTGQIVSSGGSFMAIVAFTGTNFPPSVFLETAAAATSQPTNIAPGTVTLPILTSGVPSGVSVSTSQLPSQTGVACVADTMGLGRFPNFETVNYTVVDATHITLTLNKVHGAAAVIGVGGMCGYGIEQTADTQGSLRQIFPIVGTASPTTLYYASSGVPVLGNNASSSTSGFQNISGQVSSISRSGNVVTATFTGNLPADPTGLTMTVSGVADASYDGSFQVTSTGGNQLTYSNSGPNDSSSGGTIYFINGGYVLYPMAEVLSVYDANTKTVDGQLALAANTVQWAPGDPLEEPHFYMMLTYPDTEFVQQFVPRPIQDTSAGKTYQGQVGPGMRGWEIQNAVPASNYIGGGGTHALPDDAYVVSGPWGTDFEVDAGTSSLIRAHCNIHGCNRWDSGYSLFALDSGSGGEDFLYYAPEVSEAIWTLGGQSFTFAPSGFTANNVTTTTLTAGQSQQFTVNGSGNAAGSTLNLTGGATGSNYDLNIVDGGSNQAYIGTNDNAGYAVFRFGTPTQVWQFAAGGHTSAVPDAWYIFDQTSFKTAFSIQGGTESATFAGSVTAPQYMGPSTAPTGSCSTNGAWVFSQDGHATFCSAGTWVTKI
jgi:trimeric autotransporter adhesin